MYVHKGVYTATGLDIHMYLEISSLFKFKGTFLTSATTFEQGRTLSLNSIHINLLCTLHKQKKRNMKKKRKT